MDEIILISKNLNNSLVFYRSLFNRMPLEIEVDCIQFETDQFRLKIIESMSVGNREQYILEVSERAELQEINRRMSRFRMIEHIKEECEDIGNAIELTDPDGNRWVIGDPEMNVHFEKCYIDSEILNLK